MRERAEVREYFRQWAVMDDYADAPFVVFFKYKWKRKNTLQNECIVKLNEKLLLRGRQRKSRGIVVHHHGRIVANNFGESAIYVNDIIIKGIQPRFGVKKF